MKTISFSTASAQPFWSLPVHALAPWISRFRNSLRHAPQALGAPRTSQQPLRWPVAAGPQAASNDSVFERPMPAQPGRHDVPASPKLFLRVVREADPTIEPDCAGRMVISGRMADVCAELDRMALRAGSGGES